MQGMSASYTPYHPEEEQLLPSALQDWPPQGHLAYFISDTVDSLNLSELHMRYAIHQPDLVGCQRPVAWFKLGNHGWTDHIRRIYDPFGRVQSPSGHLHEHLAHVHRHGQCTAFHDDIGQGAQIYVRDLGYWSTWTPSYLDSKYHVQNKRKIFKFFLQINYLENFHTMQH